MGSCWFSFQFWTNFFGARMSSNRNLRIKRRMIKNILVYEVQTIIQFLRIETIVTFCCFQSTWAGWVVVEFHFFFGHISFEARTSSNWNLRITWRMMKNILYTRFKLLYTISVYQNYTKFLKFSINLGRKGSHWFSFRFWIFFIWGII